MNKIIDSLYYNLWTIFCIWLTLIVISIPMVFVVEYIRWDTLETIKHHWFWDWMQIDLAVVTACYFTIVIVGTIISQTSKRRTIKIKRLTP